MIEVKYWMAIVLIFISVSLIIDFLYLYFVCSCVRDGMCVVPLTSAVIIIRDATFHPSASMSFIRGWYLAILALTLSCGNLSLV
jgi:hypothetical protein